MGFKIEEQFEVPSGLGPVWEYLTEPQRVVTCLPGAELTQVIDERTFEGRVRVKVGPVTAAFRGTARIDERDELEHRVRILGEGKEAGGASAARMTMTSRLTEASGVTRVEVTAEIDVTGKLA
jgi:uncharacterized protein